MTNTNVNYTNNPFVESSEASDVPPDLPPAYEEIASGANSTPISSSQPTGTYPSDTKVRPSVESPSASSTSPTSGFASDSGKVSGSGPGTDGPSNSSVPHHPNFYNESSASSSNPEDFYTANKNLPWRYPRGYFCSRCKNTGYRTSTFSKKIKQCSDCWNKFNKPKPQPTQHRPSPQKPTYGYPPANVHPLPAGYNMFHSYTPNMYAPGATPLILQPGDPRIGGYLCPGCKGRGMISVFLDTETCMTCRGIGRVF